MGISRILCLIGLHRWEKKGGHTEFSSNVREKYFMCSRCGKRKTVYEAK
ncbi:conserved hypothetical protein [Methanosalsum zhilinae DSM 4017]|uniref:Uncharacterized protein n=1 Tax=Methanosalsum zhilinae (strain DSM 4017 / NBRC 107636 / OCM 62 / WeN5) TaxID=679901 RepID=F7XM41_METZD|nr:hypothetical protein [Methanosalsum zhilinae]AEH61383.1 conserved hypothetical protein [Methanosalsum zhilinae DSM 4017]